MPTLASTLIPEAATTPDDNLETYLRRSSSSSGWGGYSYVSDAAAVADGDRLVAGFIEASCLYQPYLTVSRKGKRPTITSNSGAGTPNKSSGCSIGSTGSNPGDEDEASLSRAQRIFKSFQAYTHAHDAGVLEGLNPGNPLTVSVGVSKVPRTLFCKTSFDVDVEAIELLLESSQAHDGNRGIQGKMETGEARAGTSAHSSGGTSEKGGSVSGSAAAAAGKAVRLVTWVLNRCPTGNAADRLGHCVCVSYLADT